MNKKDIWIQTVLEACESKKGYQLSVLDISKVSSFADYFVICSVNNEKQGEAVADEIDLRMSQLGVEAKSKEGYTTKRWILMDYGDVIVHIFHKEERGVYKLEQLWADAEDVDIEIYGVENWH